MDRPNIDLNLNCLNWVKTWQQSNVVGCNCNFSERAHMLLHYFRLYAIITAILFNDMFHNFAHFSEFSVHSASRNCSRSSFEAHFFRTRLTKLFSPYDAVKFRNPRTSVHSLLTILGRFVYRSIFRIRLMFSLFACHVFFIYLYLLLSSSPQRFSSLIAFIS
jgi:hypothetical protein